MVKKTKLIKGAIGLLGLACAGLLLAGCHDSLNGGPVYGYKISGTNFCQNSFVIHVSGPQPGSTTCSSASFGSSGCAIENSGTGFGGDYTVSVTNSDPSNCTISNFTKSFTLSAQNPHEAISILGNALSQTIHWGGNAQKVMAVKGAKPGVWGK